MNGSTRTVPHPNGDGAGSHGVQPAGVNAHKELEPLAIVGFASHLAGDAIDNESLWQLIVEGRSAAGPFPQDRFQGNKYFHPDPDHGGSCATSGGYFLRQDIDSFDAPFFRLSEYDVAAMDPQQKLLLENVYHALENAGLPMESLPGSRTSVYVGSATNDHAALYNADVDFLIKNKATGVLPSVLANRVSWFYDLKGASITIDTACSSSLVALHMACLDLRAGGSDMAIVSGLNLLQHPASLMMLSNLGILSPDGQCYTFDDRANGYARGEGVVSVVVKPLQAAIRDGDRVRALIRATGVSSDGKTAGITLPSQQEQEVLIKTVYASAGLDMNDTSYVEAHGTGTPVGDPLECCAIMSAFRTPERKQPLYFGSIKAGVGHLEGGAGLAGVVKVIMMLERQVIPPVPNFQRLNPMIPQGSHNVQFPRKALPWPKTQLRRASVNSFGFGGTNAHAVLEAPGNILLDATRLVANPAVVNGHQTIPNCVQIAPCRLIKPHIFTISANDEQALQRNSVQLGKYIEGFLTSKSATSEADFMKNLSYTLNERRSKLKWRTSVIASSPCELSRSLSGGTCPKFRATKGEPGIAFVFTGQGAQWLGMGKTLMDFPVFRRSIESASHHLEQQGAPWKILDAFDPVVDDFADINHPLQSQTACTVLQVALVDLLLSWDIHPKMVIGHSSGEIAAAYCSGAISRDAAWNIAYYRGLVSSILQRVGGGAMIAVGLHPDEAQEYISRLHPDLQKMVQVGCYNSPKNVTITGDRDAVLGLQTSLQENGVFNRLLPIQVAYHSQYMQPVADVYLKLLRLGGISAGQFRQPIKHSLITMISSVGGQPVHGDILQDAKYWVENLISPVRFLNAITALDSTASLLNLQEIVEVGPHSALQSAIRDSLANGKATCPIRYSHTITRRQSSSLVIMHTAVGLYNRGGHVNLRAMDVAGCHPHLQIDLPGYVFNHGSGLRAESRRMRNCRLPPLARHELLGSPDLEWDRKEPRWRNFLRTAELPWLRDNKVNGSIIFPGVGYSIMAMEAVKQLLDPSTILAGFRVWRVSMEAALLVPDTKDGVEVVTRLCEVEDERSSGLTTYQFSIKTYDAQQNEWLQHCSGFLQAQCGTREAPDKPIWGSSIALRDHDNLDALRESFTQVASVRGFYDALERSGFDLGPTLHNLKDIRKSKQHGKCLTKITLPDIADYMPKGWHQPYIVHPSTMESMAHAVLHVCTNKDAPLGSAILARFIDEIWISNHITQSPGRTFACYADGRQVSPGRWRCSITVWDDETKEEVIRIRGTELWLLSAGKGDQTGPPDCFHVRWYPFLEIPANNFYMASPDSINGVGRDMRSQKDDYECLCSLFIKRALGELGDIDQKLLPFHNQQYLGWMICQAGGNDTHATRKLCRENAIRLKEEQRELEVLRARVQGYGSRGELLVLCGDSIASFLRGEEDSHRKGLIRQAQDQVYADTAKRLLSEYLQVLRHSHGPLKMLEIGARTGRVAEYILEALAPANDMNDKRIERFHYTDVHDKFFEEARKRFAPWSQLMDYSVLDLNKDLAEQGFQKHTYDVLIAIHSLHTTPTLRRSLENAYSLLKPGGKFIIVESVKPQSKYTPFVSGLFPEWWKSMENFRSSSPLIPEAKWAEILGESGFTTPFPIFRDAEDKETHEISLFVSTATRPKEQAPPAPFQDVVIICHDSEPDPLVSSLATGVKQAAGLPVRIVSLGDLNHVVLEQSLCLIVGELDDGLFDLSTISVDIYQQLKWTLLTSKHLMWISADDVDHPKSALGTGLIRTLRWERDMDQINFITLKFAQPYPPRDDFVGAVVSLYGYYFDGRVEAQPNSEFLYKGGSFWVNRLQPAPDVNRFLNTRISGGPETCLLGENMDRPLKAHFKGSGRQGHLVWSDMDGYSEPLASCDVQVLVQACSLTFRDGMAVRGDIDQPGFGIQAAGTIVEVGQAVDSLKLGGRVMVLILENGQNSLSRYVRINANFAQEIPPGTGLAEAATVPATFTAVHHSLHNVARLDAKETILVHGAISAYGQAAVQLATLAGAEVFASVNTPEQREYLIKSYKVPNHRVLLLDTPLDVAVQELTNGSGVDIVLNFLHGNAARSAWQCIGALGRFIDMALKDAAHHRDLDMYPFGRNATYVGVDIAALDRAKFPILVKTFSEVGELYRRGAIFGPAQKVFSYSEFGAALVHSQNETTVETTVVVPREDDIVQITPLPIPTYEFPPSATYVIAGGLGGLGRSAARWMCSQGVRHLILTSRSGARTEAAEELLQDLTSKGCEVRVCKCDITVGDRLNVALQACASDMPPIKGCLQSTMLLQDSMFVNMLHEQFMTGIKTKVQGSINLVNALPTDLDFFLALSSTASIVGNRGQANYNAGNAFQDAFAQHLTSKGIPGLSINLGNMLSVGWVAENDGALPMELVYSTIDERGFHALLEYHLDPRWRAAQSVETCHTVAGLRPLGHFHEQRAPVPVFMSYPLFDLIRGPANDRRDLNGQEGEVQLSMLLKESESIEAASHHVTEAIIRKISMVMSFPADEIDHSQGLATYGVDSLVTVDLRTWFAKEMGATVSTADILDGGSIRELSQKVTQQSKFVELG